MDRPRTRIRLVLGAVSVVLAAVVVSAVLVDRGSGDAPPPTAFTPMRLDNLDRAFPMDTLDDVGTHADAVVLATVLAEEEHESREAFYGSEGLIGRRITIRIDQTLWQKKNAPAPPATFETAGGSWSYSKGVRTPFVVSGEVGRQYLFVVSRNIWDSNGDSYDWIHEGSLDVPILDGRTPTVIDSDRPYFEAIRGKTTDDLERLFAVTLDG